MAWTAPRTWTDGELVNASIMNTHIRDNLNALDRHLIVRKPGDESVTSSAVMQADNDLLMAVAANEVWLTRWVLLYTGATAGDLNTRFTFPAGGEVTLLGQGPDSSLASVTYTDGTTTSPTGGYSFGARGTTPRAVATFDIQITNAGTAGNLALEWCQLVSSGTATTIKANSTLWAVKLA